MRICLIALLAFIPLSCAAEDGAPQDNAERLLDLVEQDMQGLLTSDMAVGAAIGVIDGDGAAFRTYGVMSRKTGKPVTTKTLFEIGSVTKSVTGLLLADSVERGEVAYMTAIGELLPADVVKDMGPAKDISLLSLATYRSGLPAHVIPDAINPPTPKDYDQAIVNGTAEDVYAFLKTYDPRPTAGDWLYSNGAFQVLGHVLGLKAGKSYAELLEERITSKLGMDDTVLFMPRPEDNENVPEGYVRFDERGIQQLLNRGRYGGYFYNGFSGADGGIVSTIEDMAKYAKALLDSDHISPDPWSRTLAKSIAPYAPPSHLDAKPWLPTVSGKRVYASSLGWNYGVHDDHVWVLKGGGTVHFKCFVIVSQTMDRAVVVLSNTGIYDQEIDPFMPIVKKVMTAALE
jgi:CubicO group peptidase (beta-lactamase class C family)